MNKIKKNEQYLVSENCWCLVQLGATSCWFLSTINFVTPSLKEKQIIHSVNKFGFYEYIAYIFT